MDEDNSLEVNASNAVIRAVSELGEVDILPQLWNLCKEADIPKISVKATQGMEVVYLAGVYRVSVELTMYVLVKKDNMTIENWTKAIRKGLINANNPQDLITDEHFFCYALEPEASSSVNEGGTRERTLRFDLIGFDLDRFN